MVNKRPCPHHARGRCSYGEKCKFSHDKRLAPANSNPNRPTPACHQFARTGRCKNGDACEYSHVVAVDDDAARKRREVEDLLKRWKYTIPKASNRVIPLRKNELVKFFDQALQLVEAGSESMQTVINTLASSEGLIRVRELLRQKWDQVDDGALSEAMPLLLTFFRILTQAAVRQSVVVETRYGNLLNELYGVGGQQAAPIFSTSVRYLTMRDDLDDVELVLAAFAGMLEKTDVAMVSPDLQTVAELLASLLPQAASLSRSAQRHARTVATKLKLAKGIDDAKPAVAQEAAGPKATFKIEHDLPGNRSKNGPRHDNDWEDICDIAILPTSDEIQSTRVEYLPHDDPTEWHLPGLRGLIDRHFRLIREDTVGQLRDAVKMVLDKSTGAAGKDIQTAARTHIYQNVLLENVVFDNQKGLLFVFSFDQPAALHGKSQAHRENWWEESGRLGPESLVCMTSITDGSATFLAVHSPSPHRQQNGGRGGDDDEEEEEEPVHERYTLAGKSDRSFVIAELTTSNPQDASRLIKAHASPVTGNGTLIVEFPGTILPSFGPTLTALQTMSRTQDMPFADVVVPGNASIRPSPPPAYSRRTNFKFNLSCLVPDKEVSPAPAPAASLTEIESVLERTTLDEAQRTAVSHALTNSVALIQGPPGTGKSYTGIKLIQALLANRSAAKLGPIICVCFTNHALDQLLEHLVDAGVEDMVRVGSKSKSARLADINLRKLARFAETTRAEAAEWWTTKHAISSTGGQISGCLDQIFRAERTVLTWLKEHEPDLHSQLVGSDKDGFQRVNSKKKTALQIWLEGGRQSRRSRNLPELLTASLSLFTLTHGERGILYAHWVRQSATEVYEDLEIQMQSFYESRDYLNAIRGEQDLRVLRQASVIGITTTGLARSLGHLSKLNSKVLMVEEAGEVLEAHLLTAMLPSLEHTILIGDHQQLRPKVANYDFSVENPRNQVALDVSLFERLVHPRGNDAQGLPYVTLETQRRMHPSVSQLIRSTLYPSLIDGSNVMEYPPVVGMRRRLFWLDHQQSEDGKKQDQESTSHTNAFEADMVTALVRHLQRQGVYGASDIAVLTPYLGQLRKLKQKLSSIVDVVLNDRDTNELQAVHDSGEDDDGYSKDQASRRPSVTKGNLINALRLATVDNFQGEEAKVVIISLVRSNKQRKCGFLRTSNRINVLLSRAKHGMYIIGNSTTSATVQMWQDVIHMLKADGNIGTTLELACPRHPETPLLVEKPEDFNIVAPQAGCDLVCGKQLHCGHACEMPCHSDALHNAVYCVKDCPRPKKGCTHTCKLVCGDECEKTCTEIVECDIQLPCGHRVTSLPCFLHQDPSKYECPIQTEKTIPDCEHKVTLACHIPVDDGTFVCRVPCSAPLPCGHGCKKLCYMCRLRGPKGAVEKVSHGTCKAVCMKPFTSCPHFCQALCHGDGNHPLCTEPCTVGCAHSKCPKKCSDPCTPCVENCSSGCPHSTCSAPCAAPCTWTPCSKRCQKKLSCLHQCPSICGEICPPVQMCQICSSDEVKSQRVDLISFGTYEEIDLDETPCLFLPCGHIYTAETLDMQLELSTDYEMDESNIPIAVKGTAAPLSVKKLKTCPDCRGSLRSIARYGRVVRRSLLDINTLKFIVWSNRTYTTLAERLQTLQGGLLASVNTTRLHLDHIAINGHLPSALKAAGDRYKAVLRLRTDMQVFLRDVSKEEQPYQKVHNVVEAARRRQLENPDEGSAIAEFTFDQDVLQTRGELLATSLLIRCDLIAATDLFTTIRKQSRDIQVQVNFGKNRTKCDDLCATATESKNVLQQAEANIFWAHFAAVEISQTLGANQFQEMEALKRQARAHLGEARALCDKYPGQTKPVAHEIDAIRKMLDDSVSSTEMRMVVAAMEKEFSGTGHWYYCVNRHPFTIGECGMAMELATCPQCGAAIGGQRHRAVDGVTHAGDIERNFGNLRV